MATTMGPTAGEILNRWRTGEADEPTRSLGRSWSVAAAPELPRNRTSNTRPAR